MRYGSFFDVSTKDRLKTNVFLSQFLKIRLKPRLKGAKKVNLGSLRVSLILRFGYNIRQ